MMTRQLGRGPTQEREPKKPPGIRDNIWTANSGRNYQPRCSFKDVLQKFILELGKMIPNLMVHIFQMSCFLRQLNHPWITIWVNLRCLSKVIIMKNTIQSLICSSLKSSWLWYMLPLHAIYCISLRIQRMRIFMTDHQFFGLRFFGSELGGCIEESSKSQFLRHHPPRLKMLTSHSSMIATNLN